MNIIVYEDETDPAIRLAWPGANGALRDLSGATLQVEVIARFTGLIEATKTTGLTGGDGTGESNVNIAWTAAELTALAGSAWNLRVTTSTGAVFKLNHRGSLPVLEVRPAPVPRCRELSRRPTYKITPSQMLRCRIARRAPHCQGDTTTSPCTRPGSTVTRPACDVVRSITKFVHSGRSRSLRMQS